MNTPDISSCEHLTFLLLCQHTERRAGRELRRKRKETNKNKREIFINVDISLSLTIGITCNNRK